ncbi:MAG TPA: hypothetical protein VF715_08380 [Thermoleophilaceae bacterium]|jgi:hypothetical protein
MRLGRTAAVAICAALVGAAPATAKPLDGDTKVKQCKRKDHKRFSCERTDDGTVTTVCPENYIALGFAAAPDADLNGNLVVCFAEGIGALDDTP